MSDRIGEHSYRGTDAARDVERDRGVSAKPECELASTKSVAGSINSDARRLRPSQVNLGVPLSHRLKDRRKLKNCARFGGTRVGVVVCCSMLLGVGVVNRWAYSVWIAASDVAVALDPPLSAAPLGIGNWQGVEVPLDEGVVRISGADDYINRIYVDKSADEPVFLYAAYTAHPVKLAGHRPQVCYPAHGWHLNRTETAATQRTDGAELAFQVHEFSRREVWDEQIVVLNYYVLAGRHTTDWTDFQGLRWRRPNVTRDVNRYVAQVQVSSKCGLAADCAEAQQRVARFAGEMAPFLDALLPDVSSSAGR